jgi:hypothetical protein
MFTGSACVIVMLAREGFTVTVGVSIAVSPVAEETLG